MLQMPAPREFRGVIDVPVSRTRELEPPSALQGMAASPQAFGIAHAFREAAQYVESKGGVVEIRTEFFSGKPKLGYRRLALYDVLYSLADTLSVEQTAEDLGGLERREVWAALTFAARVCEHETGT